MLVRHRRGPGRLRETDRTILISRTRLRGDRLCTERRADPVVTAYAAAMGRRCERRSETAILRLIRERHAILRRQLSSQSHGHVEFRFGEPGLDAWGRCIRPSRRVAEIEIWRHAGRDHLRDADRPYVAEEPEPIAQNRAAKCTAAVPVLADSWRGWNPARPEIVSDVVRLQARLGAAEECRPTEGIATRTRNDVGDRPARLRLAKAAADHHL